MNLLTEIGKDAHNKAFFRPNLSAATPYTKTAIGAKMNMMEAIQDTSSSERGELEGEESPMRRALLGDIQPMAVPYARIGMHTVKEKVIKKTLFR